jgi:hypothetical protein
MERQSSLLLSDHTGDNGSSGSGAMERQSSLLGGGANGTTAGSSARKGRSQKPKTTVNSTARPKTQSKSKAKSRGSAPANTVANTPTGPLIVEATYDVDLDFGSTMSDRATVYALAAGNTTSTTGVGGGGVDSVYQLGDSVTVRCTFLTEFYNRGCLKRAGM